MSISLRPATIKDCYDIWQWRNSPEVRRWSFNTEEIEYSKHKEWFERKNSSRNVNFYIAENQEKVKIGQARFEMDGDVDSYINVNLNPDFFGMGLGSLLIEDATKVFLKEKPEVQQVIAEIVADNIASCKAFEKSGYKISEIGERQKEKNIKIFICKR